MENGAWSQILSHPDWVLIPAEWSSADQTSPALALADQQSVLLFRTHRHVDPRHGLAGADALLHAAPRPIIGTAMGRLNSQKLYADAPYPFNFITLYAAGSEQKFYPDETLEYVRKGETPDEGEVLTSITAFDKVRHFETDAAKNEMLGTYLVILPSDNNTRLAGAVDMNAVRILRVTPEINAMLASLAKPVPTGFTSRP